MAYSKWEPDLLLKTWNSIYDHKYYKIHNEDKDIQGLFLLLEGVYDKVHQFATRFSNTSASYKEVLIELEEKKCENEALKKEISKLNCDKCKVLEKKLAETTKKANEAHNRMSSIAKILCMGSFEGDNDKRNTALGLVSQMLLTESSPKRKRRCTQIKNSPSKENFMSASSMDTETEGKADGAVGGIVIAETMAHSPLKHITNNTTLLDRTPSPKKTDSTSRLSSSVNIPIEKSRIVTSVKKNLSLDCVKPKESEYDVINGSPNVNKKKTLSFNINLDKIGVRKLTDETTICGNNNDSMLDETLLEYVKDGRSELEKIWFNDEPKIAEVRKDNVSTPTCKQVAETTTYLNQIIEETPIRDDNVTKKLDKKKRADFWLLKEKKELCEKSKTLDGKKLRQMKLELGVKPKEVDISKLSGFNGGAHRCPEETEDKDEDIIPGSPNSQIFGEMLVEDEINIVHTVEFRPIASSTQRSISADDANANSKRSESKKSKEFVYKRDGLKKASKAERKQLPGWDCDECRQYYSAMALSPSKIKERMNACSRHRDKFKPRLNDTPPGFWNPIFPDTQECKDKGMYVSIYRPSSSDK
ncbi:hypothetical protein O3M35_012174 [Rhynocoris fuscipes]|uniref:DNA endonuclease activator Ctp1 C-terminal domain-containing protein n=1 Tax=Rhynocoris fuscipes TaxID=488301 RepID=A0AAW1CUP9_9HEMI